MWNTCAWGGKRWCVSVTGRVLQVGAGHKGRHSSSDCVCLSVLQPLPRLALVLAASGRGGRMDGIVFRAVHSHSSPGGGDAWEQRGEERAWLPGAGWCPLLPSVPFGRWALAGPRGGCSPCQLSPHASAKLPCCSCRRVRLEGIGERPVLQMCWAGWHPQKSSWGDEESNVHSSGLSPCCSYPVLLWPELPWSPGCPGNKDTSWAEDQLSSVPSVHPSAPGMVPHICLALERGSPRQAEPGTLCSGACWCIQSCARVTSPG